MYVFHMEREWNIFFKQKRLLSILLGVLFKVQYEKI